MSTKKLIISKVLTMLLTSLLLTVVLYGPSPALAATSPSLGTAQSYVVLGASTVTNTGPTVVNGDLGVYAGSAVTGFPPGSVTGIIHAADTNAQLAQAANTIAFGALSATPNVACDTNYGAVTKDLAGLSLVPGVYCANTFELSGTLTLDDTNNANGVWIFRSASTLITSPGSVAKVQFLNSIGSSCNVWWKVGSSATLKTGTEFIGNILALTSIDLNTGATLNGRALAQTGAVTMDTNTIISSCINPTPTPPVPELPTLLLISTGILGLLGLVLMRRKRKD
jgi:Ice-binding-like